MRTGALVVVLTLAVAGCSSDDEAEPASTSPPTTPTVATAAATTIATTTVATTTTTTTTTTVPATSVAATTVAPTTESPTTVPATTVDPDAPRRVINSTLEPGAWTGQWFSQPITFELTEAWDGFENTVLLHLVLPAPSDGGLRPASMLGEIGFDVSAKLTVDETVAELLALEGIDVAEPVPSELTGLTGTALTASPLADDVHIGFAVYPDGSSWYLPAGARVEVHVLEAPDGPTLVVWIDGPDGSWDEFRPRAQAVLDSVRWEP